MGIADVFSRDDRFEIKVSELIGLVRGAASAEAENRVMRNAVNCEVPYRFIREMLDGVKEEPEPTLISETTPAIADYTTKTPADDSDEGGEF